VPVDDAGAWARTLTALASSSDAREKALQVRAHHVERFSWTASARAMMRIYEAAI